MYVQTGTELLTDEAKYVAHLAASQGVPVVFEQYEAMPHVSQHCQDGQRPTYFLVAR